MAKIEDLKKKYDFYNDIIKNGTKWESFELEHGRKVEQFRREQATIKDSSSKEYSQLQRRIRQEEQNFRQNRIDYNKLPAIERNLSRIKQLIEDRNTYQDLLNEIESSKKQNSDRYQERLSLQARAQELENELRELNEMEGYCKNALKNPNATEEQKESARKKLKDVQEKIKSNNANFIKNQKAFEEQLKVKDIEVPENDEREIKDKISKLDDFIEALLDGKSLSDYRRNFEKKRRKYFQDGQGEQQQVEEPATAKEPVPEPEPEQEPAPEPESEQEPAPELESEPVPEPAPEPEPEPQLTPKEILAQKIFSTIANYGSIDAKKESEMLDQYLHEHGTQGINDLKEISDTLKTSTYNEEKYRILAENYAQLIESAIIIYKAERSQPEFDLGAAIDELQEDDYHPQEVVNTQEYQDNDEKCSKIMIEDGGVYLIGSDNTQRFQPKLGIVKGFLERLRVVSTLRDGIEEDDMPVVPLTKFFKINPTVTKRMTGEELKEYILALRGEGTTSYEIIDNRGKQKMLPPVNTEEKQEEQRKPLLERLRVGKQPLYGGRDGKFVKGNKDTRKNKEEKDGVEPGE